VNPALLQVHDLHIEARAGAAFRPVVMGVDLVLRPGEVLGLAGESGSGKTLTALALMGLVSGPGLRVRAAGLRFGELDLRREGEAGFRALRGRAMAMVFQDPAAALDPVFRVGGQLRRALRNCGKFNRASEPGLVLAALAEVGFSEPEVVARAYPHELSGGMRQRVLVAMALAVQPQLLLADEPTTALDVSARSLVLDCLEKARLEHGMAVLLVSHDLSMLARRADRVAVMYAGRVIEQGPAAALLTAPLHPYTRALLGAVPRLDGRPVAPIPGRPPARPDLAEGCVFAPRCPRVDGLCLASNPSLLVLDGRHVACHHAP